MKRPNGPFNGMLIPLWLATAVALGAQEAPLSGLDAYVEKARAEWQVPGAAVAVVRGGEVVYARGFGVLRSDTQQPVDAHSLFAIGSSTKAMTAAALGILVDEGLIEWDDEVVDYLPQFRLPDPFLTRHITVRDLVAHRTGVRAAGLLWTGSGFSGVMKDRADRLGAQAAARRGERAAAPDPEAEPPAPTLPLEKYAWTYESDLYGEAWITVEDGRLVLERGASAADLEHVRHDTFRARWRSLGLASVLGATEIRFTVGPLGEPAGFDIAGFAEFSRVPDAPRAASR